MRKARRNHQIIFNGETIMLFQDLSQITLKNHRALRPLLDKLMEKDLRYSWRFPFGLMVNHNGKQHILRYPEDPPDFCSTLQLGAIKLPEWYQEFLLPPLDHSSQRSPFASPDNRLSKKLRPSRHGGSQAGSLAGTSGTSKLTPPGLYTEFADAFNFLEHTAYKFVIGNGIWFRGTLTPLSFSLCTTRHHCHSRVPASLISIWATGENSLGTFTSHLVL